MAALASPASPVFPSRQPWAWQCMVITTRAQSAGMQEPNKQNRQTVEGNLLRSWYDLDAGCFQHFTLKWFLGFFFFLVGGKGKADYTVTVCVCVCVTRQVYVCNCVNTEGVCMHLCTYIFCKVLTQQAMQADTAANIYALSSSKTLEGRWLVSCTCSVGIRFIMAVCFTLAAAL